MAKAKARVELHRRSDGLWAWRVRAANNLLVGNDAGQGYENRDDAISGMALVVKPGLEVFEMGEDGVAMEKLGTVGSLSKELADE